MYTENTILHERKHKVVLDRHLRKVEMFSSNFLYCIRPYTVKAQLFLQKKGSRKLKL